MGRLQQIKEKWDKKKNEILTEEQIKNNVSEKYEKQIKYDNKRRD